MAKKLLSALLIFCLLGTLFAGCNSSDVKPIDSTASSESSVVESASSAESSSEASSSQSDSPVSDLIRVGALKGPTAMGMVRLMELNEANEATQDYDFTITSIDAIVPLIIKKELDLAAIPANLASVLYNNTQGGVRVLAINPLGVLYVVEQGDTIQSVADLKGKTLYLTGKGATPDYALQFVLAKHGIDPTADLTIEYKSEPAEIMPLLLQNPEAVALLPQPFATVAQAKVENLRIALDWTKEWDAVADGNSTLITGVVVARTEFMEEFPEKVIAFLEEYKASTEFVNTNMPESALLIEKYGIVDAAIAEKALPFSNITYIDQAEMKALLEGYLQVLFEHDPTSIGGNLPDESFYYAPSVQ